MSLQKNGNPGVTADSAKCTWCESPYPFAQRWVRLTPDVEATEHLFCHVGCLIHWLFTQSPETFEEVMEFAPYG